MAAPDSTQAALGEAAAAGLFYIVAVAAFGLDQDTRRRYVGHLTTLWPRGAALRARTKAVTL
jgi:hypothetical protein